MAATTHGWSQTPTYKTWRGMIGRCTDPRNASFERYSAAGVTVCQRWTVFENFLADMGERPSGKTLDRRDGTLGYEPSNCRWATPKEQQNNTKANRRIEAFGERLTASEWSERTGISYGAIKARLRMGWPPEVAVSRPMNQGQPRPLDALHGFAIREV